MTEEELGVVTLDTEPAKKSVKDLRQELRTLKDTLLSVEEGTEKYNKAMARAAEIQHILKEQMEEVNANAMDFGQIASNIVKTTGGLVGGLQAAKAAMNLFGIENEEVLKSLQKMQSLMAITQALPAIDQGVKAFRRLGMAIKGAAASMNGLKAALISTGIGAAVVAVGLLAANWDKVKSALTGVNKEYEDLKNKKIDEYVKNTNDELQKQISLQERIARIWGGNDVDIATVKVNALTKAYNDQDEKIEELNNKRSEYYRLLGEASRSGQDRTYGKDKEYWESVIRANDIRIQQAKQLKTTLEQQKTAAESELEVAKILQEEQEKADKANKKTAESTNELKKSVSELELIVWEAIQRLKPSSLQDELLAKFGGSGIPIPVKFELEEDEEEDTSFEDAFRQKIESTVENLRNAFITPDEQYQQEINALDVALKTKLIKEEEYLKLRDALNREQTQREVMRYSTAAASIGDIFTSLGDLMEEGSEEQKALQIMGATINMLSGITAAIAGAFTTHSGPWDIVLAALQATAIAASGAATIAKMSKTTKDNAKSSSGYRPNTSSMTNLIAPVQYTQDVQGANIEGAIRDSKVYVTETDITNTQNRVRVSESEATF